MIKQLFKKNKKIYKFLLNTREILRIFFNTKTRSRFLWRLRDGDNTLTLNYPLNEESVVFDVGAYKGEFTSKIHNKFNCKVYAFEPVNEYYEELKKRFKEHPKVIIFNFGLLDISTVQNINKMEAGSSLFPRDEAGNSEKIIIKSISEFLNEEKIKKIDYLYLNIEGSEYKLLNKLIQEEWIKNINHLQIQFHNYIENARSIRRYIRKELSKTHKCKFNFPFIWERWDIKR